MRVRSLLAGLLFASPAFAVALSAPPPTAALLAAALSEPATGYAARGRIQAFEPGRTPKALDLAEYHLPDGRFRREIRRRGAAEAVTTFVDDGVRTRLYWPKLKTVWTQTSPRETAAQEAARLLELYAITVSSGGRVAGRATWRLVFAAPDGRARRALWVDRATGVPLKCEEYRLDGALARRERFTAISFVPPDDALFRLDIPPGVSTAAATAPRGASDPEAVFPQWIPDGFLSLGLRDEDGALTVEYGDGVASFTLRESKDEQEPPGGRAVRLENGRSALLLPGDGVPLLSFSSRGRSFRVTGEITEEEMVRLADSLGGSAP